MFREAHVQLFQFMCNFNKCVKLCMGSSYHDESEPMNVGNTRFPEILELAITQEKERKNADK